MGNLMDLDVDPGCTHIHNQETIRSKSLQALNCEGGYRIKHGKQTLDAFLGFKSKTSKGIL
jgi:hypothetical protein